MRGLTRCNSRFICPCPPARQSRWRDLVLVQRRGVLHTYISDDNFAKTRGRAMIRDWSGICLFQAWDNQAGWVTGTEVGERLHIVLLVGGLCIGPVASGDDLPVRHYRVVLRTETSWVCRHLGWMAQNRSPARFDILPILDQFLLPDRRAASRGSRPWWAA